MENRLANVIFKYRELVASSLQELSQTGELSGRFFATLMETNFGPIATDMDTGRTLLHYMAMNGVADVLKPLVDAGYNVNDTESDRRTALHLAVVGNHAHAVKALVVQCGANVNLGDYNDLLPFHYALSIDMDNVVETRERAIFKASILRILASRTDPSKVKGWAKRLLDKLRETPNAVLTFEVTGVPPDESELIV